MLSTQRRRVRSKRVSPRERVSPRVGSVPAPTRSDSALSPYQTLIPSGNCSWERLTRSTERCSSGVGCSAIQFQSRSQCQKAKDTPCVLSMRLPRSTGHLLVITLDTGPRKHRAYSRVIQKGHPEKKKSGAVPCNEGTVFPPHLPSPGDPRRPDTALVQIFTSRRTLRAHVPTILMVTAGLTVHMRQFLNGNCLGRLRQS